MGPVLFVCNAAERLVLAHGANVHILPTSLCWPMVFVHVFF